MTDLECGGLLGLDRRVLEHHLPEVSEATCPNGSTADGWLKVYSSGATEWKWSTRTSDNDAHDIYIEIDAPGVHTLELSARGDHHLIDRIVLHHESVDDNTATDAALMATPCAP